MPKLVGKHWEERVKSLKGETPNWGAGRIATELQREAEEDDRTDAPSERWVGIFLQKVWNKMKPEEQQQYQYFRWPESMALGLLPWEASTAALELLELHRVADPEMRLETTIEKPLESRGTGWGRPSVRLTRWFWYITQAAPDLPTLCEMLDFPPYMLISGRYDIAVVLAKWEAIADIPQRLRDAVEEYLTYAPWRSPERALQYMTKVENGNIPMLHIGDLLDYADWRLPSRENF